MRSWRWDPRRERRSDAAIARGMCFKARPEEPLERRHVNVARAARAMGIPAAELERAKREVQAREIGAVPP